MPGTDLIAGTRTSYQRLVPQLTQWQCFGTLQRKKNLAYKKTKDITKEEWKQFVNKVKLPGNRTGQFKKDAFDKAVKSVMDVWEKLFVDVENKNPDGCVAYLKNWNLDTGVDEDVAYFWS